MMVILREILFFSFSSVQYEFWHYLVIKITKFLTLRRSDLYGDISSVLLI